MSHNAGELEPDYDSDFWADHDENCHGTIDSDFCRKKYPQGFLWSCCDEPGDDEGGCTTGRHLGVAGVLKPARLEQPNGPRLPNDGRESTQDSNGSDEGEEEDDE